MTESHPNTCSECGKSVPTDSKHQICPACLMAQAFASRTIDAEGSPPPEPPPSPEEIADKFPQFEVTECLGRGGMGVVYKARQKSLNRWVAIKVLAPEKVGDEKFAERFSREAQTLALLNHPNIVTVFDYGETDGLYYIVMEFVDGVNLRDLLRDGKIESAQALTIVPPICEALQYAHDKGIVHRDIKPENLLIDRDGRVKIADFGIASLVGATGESSGTPPYMAPEQGAHTDVDHRADIYALGAVLYEMLTGDRPASPLDLPSKKVQLDIRIDDIVLRALSKEPERRYRTANEFQTVVERIIPDIALPVQSTVASQTESAQPKRGMFRRWWWVFLVMIFGGLLLGVGVLWLGFGYYMRAAQPEGGAQTSIDAEVTLENPFASADSIAERKLIPDSNEDEALIRIVNDYLDLVIAQAEAAGAGLGESHPSRVVERKAIARFEEAHPDLPESILKKLSGERLGKFKEELTVLHDGGLGPSHPQVLQAKAKIEVMEMMFRQGEKHEDSAGNLRATPASGEAAAMEAKLKLKYGPEYRNRKEALLMLPNARVMQVGLEDPMNHVAAWLVLNERCGRGEFGEAEAHELIGKITDWFRRERPDGEWGSFAWIGGFLGTMRENELVTEEDALDFLQVFYAAVRVDPFLRVREGESAPFSCHLRNVFHDNLLGYKLLNEIRTFTVDGKPITVTHKYGRTGHSGWLEEYSAVLEVAHLSPGKYLIKCEMDSALVAVSDLKELPHNLSPEEWPTIKRGWKRLSETELTVYSKDSEIVMLLDDPALNPVESAGLSAKPIIIRPKGEGLEAAVSVSAERNKGVSYGLKVTLKIGGKAFPCGRFWYDGVGESYGGKRKRVTYSVDIGALDSKITEAEIILSPAPESVEAYPGVDRIWSQEIVLGEVPLRRLDMSESDAIAAIEVNLKLKHGSEYKKNEYALRMLPNSRIVELGMEDPSEMSPWMVLKERADQGEFEATEASDLMNKMILWIRRDYPDGCLEHYGFLEQFLFKIHFQKLVLEKQTMDYLQALFGNGSAPSMRFLRDGPERVRFCCKMGVAPHRREWFGYEPLRELKAVSIDGQPVKILGKKRRGLMNGAGYAGEIDVSKFASGKHLVRFEIHSGIVSVTDKVGLDDSAPSEEWPAVKRSWTGHVEAELIIPTKSSDPENP